MFIALMVLTVSKGEILIPELIELYTLNKYNFLHISHAVMKRVFKKNMNELGMTPTKH